MYVGREAIGHNNIIWTYRFEPVIVTYARHAAIKGVDAESVEYRVYCCPVEGMNFKSLAINTGKKRTELFRLVLC